MNDATRLEAVTDAFCALPVEQLIAESILRTENSATGPRLAGAAVFGFSRSGQYVDTARGLMDQIMSNAEQISWHMEAYSVIREGIDCDYDHSPLAKTELSRAVSHDLGAKTLSMRSEIHWHLYAECLDRAWYFLRNSAEHFDSGFSLKPVQQDYIVIVREFRNHLAHRDKAIANIDSPDWRSMSRNSTSWYEVGYERDNRNRIKFSPVSGNFKGKTLKMPMSQEGFQQFKNIIAYTYEHLERVAVDRLIQYFMENPEAIPRIDQIGSLSNDYIEPAED